MAMSAMDNRVETVEDLLKGIEGEHKSNKARVESDLAEVEETLNQMKMEIHSVAGKPAKDAYNAKITTFKTRVAAAKKSLLFSGSSSAAAASSGSSSLAARQQSQEEKQAASLEVLKKSRQQLAETEATGVSTVNELDKQNNQIKKSRENMDEVKSNLNHSNKLLNKMSQWFRG